MKSKVSGFLKAVFGVSAFVFISAGFIGNAKANTVTFNADTDVVITEEAGAESVDAQAIMDALDGKELTDGGSYVINDDYMAQVDITMEAPSKSQMTVMSSTTTYIANCNINIIHLGTYALVATITHQISLTVNDSGLVHINSGSVSVSTLVSYVTGYAYGYSITNTNGDYSYASGMVRLYEENTGYYYYGCGVTVSKGCSPSFTFSQV